MKVLIPSKDGVKEGEYSPDLYIVLEVGRELQLPAYMTNVKKVRAIKALTPHFQFSFEILHETCH